MIVKVRKLSYKELEQSYKNALNTIDRLNNIINELERTVASFIEKHTEDYFDWKYDENIYNAQDRILQKLYDEFLNKLKELKESEK